MEPLTKDQTSSVMSIAVMDLAQQIAQTTLEKAELQVRLSAALAEKKDGESNGVDEGR